MFCWFYKFMISHTLDNGNRPSGITEKHICHCADCRQFYKTSQSLGESLILDAAISNTRTSKRLSERILRAIPDQRTETHKVGTKLWASAAAACLALIVLIGALLLVAQRNGRDDVLPSQTQMALAIRELRAVYKQVGQDLPTWPDVIEEPLTSELESLSDDTESAVRFLVACVVVDIANSEGGPLN